jgi:hypothetical protein
MAIRADDEHPIGLEPRLPDTPVRAGLNLELAT